MSSPIEPIETGPAAAAETVDRELIKSAVHERYWDLVSEGTSPTSAAVNAIREIGTQPTQSHTDFLSSAEADEGEPAPRQLRFDLDGDTSTMQRSASAPTMPAAKKPQPTRGKTIPHKNKDLWRGFGIHLPAGRSLKRIYGGGKLDPVPGALPDHLKRGPHPGPVTALTTYMAVNNLNVGSAGLQYRKSMNIFDMCIGEGEFVKWGDAVEGYRLDAGWIQVGERYLPTIVNKIQLLKPWRGPKFGVDHLRAEGLSKHQSLPALKKRTGVSTDPLFRIAELESVRVGGKGYVLPQRQRH